VGAPGAAIEPGHAGIRFVNPATGGDALASLRTEMHRLAEGTSTPVTRTVGSSVWQVFSGEGVVQVGERRFDVAIGDLVAVPSWEALSFHAGTDLDLFTFNDAPVYQALRLYRSQTGTDVR
jgi:gentisate 1,2-dioxygenase